MRNAAIGAGIWLALAIAGRFSSRLARSWIEFLFLFAVLTIVPLGIELTMRLDGSRLDRGLESLIIGAQFVAALCAATSFYYTWPPVCAALAAPWFAYAVSLVAARIHNAARSRSWTFDEICGVFASLYLAVGAAWFLASRLGWQPVGFREPIVLLTAVHFHYAGFASAVLVRAVGRALGHGLVQTILYRLAAGGVLGGPAILAAGFVIGPVPKLAAALVMAFGEIALAVCFVACLRQVDDLGARILLLVSAVAVAVAMCLAALWAIGEFPRQPFLDIARMAEWHGSLNALGFTLCGLAAFSLCIPDSLMHKVKEVRLKPDPTKP